jgi:hypothetical protein
MIKSPVDGWKSTGTHVPSLFALVAIVTFVAGCGLFDQPPTHDHHKLHGDRGCQYWGIKGDRG